MKLTTRKLVHTFGALADLGQEITDSSNFGEMVLTSLHLLLGALGIRRGAIAEYDVSERLFRIAAVRGLEKTFPATLLVSEQARTTLLKPGLAALDFNKLDQARPGDATVACALQVPARDNGRATLCADGHTRGTGRRGLPRGKGH